MMCMSYIPHIKNEVVRIDYVRTMKQVCEKKKYLEVEYARCCMMIVKYKERTGASKEDIIEAAKIMENVQVETYGSMDKYEKLEFILYQMKLNIILADFTKLIIVSKKVNPKFFKDESFSKLEITFYLYRLYYHQEKDEYAECAECLNKVQYALARVEKYEQVNKDKIKTEDDYMLRDYDAMVSKLYLHFLNRKNACESFISMTLLADFSLIKLSNLKKDWETHQATWMEIMV